MTKVKKGAPKPLGASSQKINNQSGINFALFSAQAKKVELCLFLQGQETRIPMQRSGDIWHLWVANVAPETPYGYRITGTEGALANPQKLMLDPYAKAVVGNVDLSSEEKRQWFLLADSRDNGAIAPKAVVIDEHFNWQGDKKPNVPWQETIIYEMHVKGFTAQRQDIPPNIRGTYAGIGHPNSIAYLKELGITSVELLPVNQHFDEPHLQQKGLQNYWGYSSAAMFAVEGKYSAQPSCSARVKEFKSMVKALHQAGIEVILDVVFNHSFESEKDYPTICQRGIDDRTYYWQDQHGNYINVTGCGNTLNLANEASRQWVLDCLRYWVKDCHIDGFRFDLATVLGRDKPDFNPKAQLFAEIKQDPILSQVKMIAEPWDIGLGGYQVGNFPDNFAEWNDHFRDDISKFWLWKSGELGAFAERFAGSSAIYQKGNKRPHNSINFITAHDGFTLRDLCSYNHKHNLANGEENRDGRSENYSYNHGTEGDKETNAHINYQRFLSSSALLATLLLSNGTPMLVAGDEFGNTQYGNNNAYCQDNEITWLNWQDFNQDLFQVTKNLIALRKQILSLTNDSWWTAENVAWLTINAQPMAIEDWHNREVKAFQIQLDDQWLLLINGKDCEQQFLLSNGQWKVKFISNQQAWRAETQTLTSLGICVLEKKEDSKDYSELDVLN